MTQTEALRWALEALEGFYEYGYDRLECFEYVTAIKEALAQPEQGVAEGSEHNVGGISHSIIKHPGGKHQVVVKHGDKVAHTSLHNSEEDAKKSLASQVAHSKKMLKVDEQGVAEGSDEGKTGKNFAKIAPRHKPLSDEQIEEIAEGYLVDYRIPAGCAWDFARDIEAFHNIKE